MDTKKKYNLYLKKTINTAIKSAIMIAISIGLYIYSSRLKAANDRELIALEAQVISLKAKVNNFRDKLKEVRDATEIWENISHKFGKINGLNLDAAKILSDKLAIKYKLPRTPELRFSPPEIRGSDNPELEVVSTHINLKVVGVEDVSLLNFCNEFNETLPGISQIVSMRVHKKRDIEEGDIQAIRDNNLPELIEAELEIKWQGIRNVSV